MGQCGANVSFAATETIGIPASTITYSKAPGSFFNVGTTTVIATATNAVGTSTCSFTVTVVDNQFPVLTGVPANTTVECNAVPAAATVTASDNCSTSVPSYTETRTNGNNVNNYTLTRTWSTTDASGNTSTATQTITVQDTQNPVISCPFDKIVNAEPGQCSATVNFTVTATDNCGTPVITYSKAPGTVFNLGSTTVIATATDAAGNQSSCSFKVIVVDNQPPIVITKPITVYLNASGQASISPADVDNGSNDNCGPVTLSFQNSGTICATANEGQNLTLSAPQGTVITGITFASYGTPNGGCGNFTLGGCHASNSKTIVQNYALGQNSVTIPATNGVFGDPCGGTYKRLYVEATYAGGSPSSTSFDCSKLGNNTVTLKVADANGNVSTGSAVVTVRDNIVPVITCPDNINTIATSAAGATVTYATPAGTDNCTATTTRTAGLASGATFPIGVTTVTYQVTDASGNSAQCSFTVTVGGVAPQIVCPANITVFNTPGQCGANVGFAATETTAIPASTITYSIAPGSFFSVGTTTVTATATNAVGTSSCTFTVTVIDNQFPVLVGVPANTTVECDAVPAAAIVTATDNCSTSAPTFTEVRADGNCPNNYILTRTWSTTDASNNTTTAIQVITVQDTKAPVLTIPANISVVNDNNVCGATVTFAATATDNCSTPTITYSQNPGTVFAIGTTVVTVTATDACGNPTVQSFTVTVTDTQFPVLVGVPANTTVECDAVPSAAIVTATDNCSTSSPTYTEVRTDGNCPNNYTLTRTWSTTDASNNSTTLSQVITVQDTKAPVLSAAPANITVACNAVPAAAILTATDNCSSPTVVLTETSTQATDNNLMGYYNYVITRTWTATDACGNQSSSVQIITVQDKTAPVINCPVVATTCNNLTGNSKTITITAMDNCNSPLTTSWTLSGATAGSGSGATVTANFNVGTTTISWTVKDVSGNTSTCTTTVVVNPLPVASITTSNADASCNSFVLTGSSTLSGPYGYQWYFNNALAGSGQTLTLGLTNGDGNYALYTTDANGCRSATAATYNYQKQNLVNSYTILAWKEVEMGKYNKVSSGSVGVMTAKGEAEFKSYSMVNGPGAFVKSPKIDKDGSGIVIPNQIIGIASVTLPTMQYNTASTNNLPNYTASVNNATVAGNFKNLTIKKGISVTVTGNTYESIKLEEGASISFTTSVLNIGSLSADKGPKNYGYSYIRFAPNTSVRVSSKVSIGSQVLVNPEANRVTFYMGDLKKDEEKFTVKGGDTRVIANIYMPDGKLRVTATDCDDDDDKYSSCDHKAHSSKDCKHKGHDHNDCDHKAHSASVCNDDVYMTGLFIAEEVESKGNTVIWNSYDCSAPPAIPIVSTNTQSTQTVIAETKVAEVKSTEEDLKVTVMPNPTTTYFTLKLESKYETPVNMRVMDASGRVVDARSKIGSNSTIQIGHNYSSGTYYAEMTQGTKRKVLQLIKLK